MSSPHIRPAWLEDLPAILALERGIVEAPHWPEEVYRSIVTADTAEFSIERCLLIALRSGEIVGFAAGSRLVEVAELESVAVAAPARQAGIGRALCVAVMEWAWAKGATAMALEVRSSSAGAIRLYQGLGFVQSGLRTDYYHEPEDDALLMQLDRRGVR